MLILLSFSANSRQADFKIPDEETWEYLFVPTNPYNLSSLTYEVRVKKTWQSMLAFYLAKYAFITIRQSSQRESGQTALLLLFISGEAAFNY